MKEYNEIMVPDIRPSPTCVVEHDGVKIGGNQNDLFNLGTHVHNLKFWEWIWGKLNNLLLNYNDFWHISDALIIYNEY